MEKSISFKSGNWDISFDEAKQQLTLRHGASGATVIGTVGMTVGNDTWSIGIGRDAVPQRLALMTPQKHVQGYVNVCASGDAVELSVAHRTAQSFHGEFRLEGTAELANAFACRVQSPTQHHVVIMGAGLTDSATNDALFDRENDRCLTFAGAETLSLTTRDTGKFSLSASLLIHEARSNVLTINLEQDYYRRRYVPYYTPIDRKRSPSPPTGWMSWNVYFDQAGAEENLAEARIGKKYLQPFGMEFWSIESWQGDSDHLPVSDFDNLSMKAHKTQFPLGMKKLAQDIRALGFRPGIWTAPFGTGSKEFYDAHKDWFLHDENGEPLKTWNGKYTIDPSNDEVIDWLRHIHDVMAHDWGYEFFKIDGMSGRGPGYCAHFYEMDNVRARFKNPDCPNPFERCVKAFREGIGPDRVFLACQGHYTGPEAGLADASRTGGDIVVCNTFSNWGNICSQARATLAQLFVNNIVFWMDPDTLLVGDYRPIEEARVTATLITLPGQMMFAGDKLAELKPERMRMLQQALPVCDVHPMDLYPIFEYTPVWDLKIRRPFENWDVVALFNWDDTEHEVGFDFAEIGLDSAKSYAIFEFWTDEFQDYFTEAFSMNVPPHAVRLLAVHEEQQVPQLLSTDRHLTQGAVDVVDMSWNSEKSLLAGTVKLVGGFPTTLTILLPDGYSHGPFRADCTSISMEKHDDGTIRLKLLAEKTGQYHIEFCAEKDN